MDHGTWDIAGVFISVSNWYIYIIPSVAFLAVVVCALIALIFLLLRRVKGRLTGIVNALLIAVVASRMTCIRKGEPFGPPESGKAFFPAIAKFFAQSSSHK